MGLIVLSLELLSRTMTSLAKDFAAGSAAAAAVGKAAAAFEGALGLVTKLPPLGADDTSLVAFVGDIVSRVKAMAPGRFTHVLRN